MNEINFFEENKKKIELNFDSFDFKYKNYILPIVIISIFLLFIILSITTSMQISNLTEEKSNLEFKEAQLISQNNNLTNILNEDEIIVLKEDSIDLIDNLINYSDVSPEILQELKDCIPSTLFLTGIDISDGLMTITGYAKSITTIAKFQNSLSNSEYYNNAFVSDVDNDLGNYNFTLTADVWR